MKWSCAQVAALTFLFVGCGNAATPLSVANEEVSVEVRLDRVARMGEQPDDLVFGHLTITGKRATLLTADLDCIWLHVGSRMSNGIYVQSFNSVLTRSYPAEKGTISVAVYWSLPGEDPKTGARLSEATLTIRPRYPRPCFKFE